MYPFPDPEDAVVRVTVTGRIKSTRRLYQQDYMLILQAVRGKIASLCGYFDPVRAAKAQDRPILGFES